MEFSPWWTCGACGAENEGDVFHGTCSACGLSWETPESKAREAARLAAACPACGSDPPFHHVECATDGLFVRKGKA